MCNFLAVQPRSLRASSCSSLVILAKLVETRELSVKFHLLTETEDLQNVEKIFVVVGNVKAIRICHRPELNSSRPKGDCLMSNKVSTKFSAAAESLYNFKETPFLGLHLHFRVMTTILEEKDKDDVQEAMR
ncbi:hypothetical protein HID58_003026 [Brassica napus]|uniref:Uncharacterized protein n=1 Tax=Brassica napus TaxID=3708 RepID=A0ABQ8EP97_BRANA|nr:hypothetical protein HID58_003026 [Brassica napus]